MAEIKKEEAKKDLEGALEKEKAHIQKKTEEQMPAEERKALEAKRAEEDKKAEETRLAVEAQAKKDAELLAKKDEEITEEGDKKRKTELLEKKAKEDEDKLSAEDKIKRIKEETQKRIDEVTNKLKEITDKSSKEAQMLRQKIDSLEKEKAGAGKSKEDILALVEQEEAEKQKKYLTEDKSLPREKRRELTDDEVDDWLLEDQKSAIAWIQRRELRRELDRRNNLIGKQKEAMSKALFEKQASSLARVLIKHPELDTKKRAEELKAQGKSGEEIDITLREENAKYAAINKIADEHPEWRFEPNAPELAMEEMEKVLVSNHQEDNKNEVDKLLERIEHLEAEISRRGADEGIPPGFPKKKEGTEKLTENEEAMVSTMKTSGASQTMIDSALKKLRAKNAK